MADIILLAISTTEYDQTKLPFRPTCANINRFFSNKSVFSAVIYLCNNEKTNRPNIKYRYRFPVPIPFLYKMKSVKYIENNEYLAYSVLTSISIAVTYSELVLVLDNYNKN